MDEPAVGQLLEEGGEPIPRPVPAHPAVWPAQEARIERLLEDGQLLGGGRAVEVTSALVLKVVRVGFLREDLLQGVGRGRWGDRRRRRRRRRRRAAPVADAVPFLFLALLVVVPILLLLLVLGHIDAVPSGASRYLSHLDHVPDVGLGRPGEDAVLPPGRCVFAVVAISTIAAVGTSTPAAIVAAPRR